MQIGTGVFIGCLEFEVTTFETAENGVVEANFDDIVGISFGKCRDLSGRPRKIGPGHTVGIGHRRPAPTIDLNLRVPEVDEAVGQGDIGNDVVNRGYTRVLDSHRGRIVRAHRSRCWAERRGYQVGRRNNDR